MNARETVKTLQSALQSGDFKKAKTFLSDDFQFSGPIPEPVNGEQWMGISTNLKVAFPNLDYHFGIESAEGNVVHISAQLSGKHTGNLDLTAMGMGVIPATGKSFSAKREQADVTLRGDKVASWAVQPTEGAGLVAVLSQLGIQVPVK
jgi:SnoaL-like polyketide cyclase